MKAVLRVLRAVSKAAMPGKLPKDWQTEAESLIEKELVDLGLLKMSDIKRQDPDDKAFRKYSEDATILFKKPNLNGVHIGEVKLVDGDWHVAGRSGYVLVVTGSGPSMQDAIDSAYQAVKNVMIPNMFYRDDIGQRWFTDVDMLLSWGYL